jgi:ribosomal protein S18 acetylase RimI-like enzyme
MNVLIRKFNPSDRDHILSLVERFSKFELPAWRPKEEIDRANRSFLEQAMKEPAPNAAIFIAETESGDFAGFIHLQTQTDYFSGEKHGYISDLAVAQEFECHGIGRQLLETAEEWARSSGYHLLTLYVFAGNSRARRIYEKYGFRQEVIKYAKGIQ